MTAPTDAPAVPDDEIRDWARSTGRKVGERGRVSPSLRDEYEQLRAGMHAGPTDGALAGAPPEGAEKPPERPRPAAPETRPGRVPKGRKSGLGRLREWFNGASTDAKGKTTPKAKPDRPRTSLSRFLGNRWDDLADFAEHVNVPVARTMSWQAPYVGIVADDVIEGTPVDKLLQPIARAERKVTGAGAMIATPIIVGLISSDQYDPGIHGARAAAAQQVLHKALAKCIAAQLEMFGSPDFAAKVRKSAGERTQRKGEIDEIIGMIFAPIPDVVTVPENATAAQVQEAQARAQRNADDEIRLREAAAAIKFLPPPGPDERGEAAERAAASMAASGNAAAAAEAAAIEAART